MASVNPKCEPKEGLHEVARELHEAYRHQGLNTGSRTMVVHSRGGGAKWQNAEDTHHYGMELKPGEKDHKSAHTWGPAGAASGMAVMWLFRSEWVSSNEGASEPGALERVRELPRRARGPGEAVEEG